MDIKELEKYPYVAVDFYESVCAPEPVWVGGNMFITLSDGRTYLRRFRLNKRGRMIKTSLEEDFVARSTLYQKVLKFGDDGNFYFDYEKVPPSQIRGEYVETATLSDEETLKQFKKRRCISYKKMS